MHATLKNLTGGLFLLVVGAAPLSAQMETDRPDFTEGTATVPDGRIQLEAGYTYATAGELTGHQIGEALVRFGLIPGLELRAELPSFQSVSGDFGLFEIEESGWSDAGVGMKLGLYEAGLAEGLPSVSLLLGTSLPTGDDDFGADGWEPEAILALGWQFTPGLGLGANVGYAQREPVGEERHDEWVTSVALELPVTSSVGAFVEYFAIRPDTDFDEDADYVDGGLTFLLSPTFQLDGRIGYNLDGDADEMFFGVGLAKLF
ncbi:MAG TPA: transporter [Longimicrobiales bacterium]